VGVSPGLLFHYFGSQRKFRHAVVQAAAKEVLAQVEPDPALSAAQQLHSALETFTDYVARNPGLYLAVVRFAGSHRELRSLHSSFRQVFAEWLTDGLGAAGVPLTQPVRTTVAGWLAFVEEVLIAWLDEPRMSRAEIVEMCEKACYALIEAAVADPAGWPGIERAIRRRPEAETD
jgi:AcrR family transcriptional regulator